MKKRARRRRASIPTKTAHSVLAEDVKQIEAGRLAGARFSDLPGAVPRAAEAQRISIRLPVRLLAILKAAAAKVGVDYQVVLKRWLAVHVRDEQCRIQQRRTCHAAPSFPLVDCDPAEDGTHYRAAESHRRGRRRKRRAKAGRGLGLTEADGDYADYRGKAGPYVEAVLAIATCVTASRAALGSVRHLQQHVIARRSPPRLKSAVTAARGDCQMLHERFGGRDAAVARRQRGRGELAASSTHDVQPADSNTSSVVIPICGCSER
jgi:hypothetical protein